MADDLESAFWASAKLREKIGEAYESLYYTPASWIYSFLRIYDNMLFRQLTVVYTSCKSAATSSTTSDNDRR